MPGLAGGPGWSAGPVGRSGGAGGWEGEGCCGDSGLRCGAVVARALDMGPRVIDPGVASPIMWA